MISFKSVNYEANYNRPKLLCECQRCNGKTSFIQIPRKDKKPHHHLVWISRFRHSGGETVTELQK